VEFFEENADQLARALGKSIVEIENLLDCLHSIVQGISVGTFFLGT
jgi:hypothetical protein